MEIKKGNLFSHIPKLLPDEELFEVLAVGKKMKIERILSHGHITPEGEWYDQDRDEWVWVVQGEAVIDYEDGSLVNLQAGDYLHIPAHVRHRVEWTPPEKITIWLAVHY